MSDRQFGKVRFVCGKNGGKYPYNHSLYFRGDRIRAVLDPASSQDKMLGLKDEGWMKSGCRTGMKTIFIT